MVSVCRTTDTFLYQQVYDFVTENIDNGTLRPGDKLPSLRKLSTKLGVSVPTVRQAYIELESQRRVESRPKSGFYVRAARRSNIVKLNCNQDGLPKPVATACRTVMDKVYDAISQPDLVPFGVANPCMAQPATKGLHRSMKRVIARTQTRGIGYASTLGDATLRRQIAYRYLDQAGVNADPEQILITNGGQEALLLALSSVAQRGDVVAVESPTYHGLLELIDNLGMLAIEVETCPEEGVMISALERTLKTHPVKACMFSTTLSNPLGVTMPAPERQRLVDLIEAHDAVLIEDDVYGELLFDESRPTPAQFLSDSNKFMTCGSFSKTAAPGYRLGWLLAGERIDQLRRMKRAFSCSSGLLQQLTLADFLASGDYDRHLRRLRPTLRVNAERMRASVAEHFPEETRTSCPVGGSVLWIELPENVDSGELFDQAMDAGISVAPGLIFAPHDRFRHHLRLSFGHPWSERIEESLRWLGDTAKAFR